MSESEEQDKINRWPTATLEVKPGMERSWCRNIKLIVSNDWFDYAVAGLIFVNCVFLALDDPTREASPAHNHEKM